MNRGDIVLVEFPYVEGGRGKNRPALVVQHDRDNHRLANTIVAMISGDLRYAAEPTQVLVDPNTPAGSSLGLHGASVVKANNLYTIRQQDVLRMLGRLSGQLLQDVNTSLKVALDLP